MNSEVKRRDMTATEYSDRRTERKELKKKATEVNRSFDIDTDTDYLKFVNKLIHKFKKLMLSQY